MREQLPASIKSEEQILTENQLSTANMFLYHDLRRIFSNQARDYVQHSYGKTNDLNSKLDTRKNVVYRTKLILEDLYFAKDPQEILAIKNDWGEEGDIIEHLLHALTPEIEICTNKRLTEAHSYTKIDQAIASTASGLLLAGNTLTGDQKAHMLEMSGYSAQEALNIIKRTSASSLLTLAVGYTSFIIGGAAYGIGLTHPFVGDITSDGVSQMVTLSYLLLEYPALVAEGYQNARLMDDEDINTCLSLWSFGTYFLSKKALSNHRFLKNSLVMLGTVLPVALVQEGPLLSSLTLPTGPSAVILRNVSGFASGVVKVTGQEAWLRTKSAKSGK